MKKFKLVVLALVLLSSLAMAQNSGEATVKDGAEVDETAAALTVTNTDGGVDGVIRGVTYTVTYDAYAGSSTVYPNNNGEAPNGDVGVDISGDVGTNITVEMNLPDHLTGTGGTTMAITFPSSGPNSGIRIETADSFNPNITNTFNFGGAGTCNLRLGYIITIPPNINIAGDAFVCQLLINAYYTGM